ncbi:MAG: (Fe-S)-binding protein, partial [bacterium]
YDVYVDIKNIFDPMWILNAGKIVNIPDAKEQTGNNRYIFTSAKNLDKKTVDEVEKCHGCNDCMRFCQAYEDTGFSDEGFKARGRANLMRAIVSGIITEDELSHALNYIDACRLCGKCFEKCPTGIDIIKLASILREKGILPIRLKEKLLMNLYSPYKRYLIWKLSRKTDGSKVNINFCPAMFKLALYYLPYLKELGQIIKKKKLIVETNIPTLNTYLERYI